MLGELVPVLFGVLAFMQDHEHAVPRAAFYREEHRLLWSTYQPLNVAFPHPEHDE